MNQTRQVLAIRDVRLVLTGLGLSWIGDAFTPIALSVAIVLSGGGASELGIILASALVSRLLFTLVGGVWADRLAPHRVMVVADLLRAASTGGIALAFALGDPPVWLLSVLVAATTGIGAFFFPAFVSLRPIIVPHDLRRSANATISLAQSASQIGGPILAGIVVAHFGSVTGFCVNAATFLWSALCVARVSARAERSGERKRMLTDLKEGIVAIRQRTWLWTGLLSAAMFHLASGVFIVLLEITAVRDLGGAKALGAISAAQGVGGVLGGLIAMRVQPRRILFWGFVTLAAMSLFPLTIALEGPFWWILAGGALGQMGLMFFSVAWDTTMQDEVPHQLIARVASWDILISFIAIPVGNLLAGPLSERVDLRTIMMAIAVWFLLAGCWPLLIRDTREIVRQEHTPAPMENQAGQPVDPSAAHPSS